MSEKELKIKQFNKEKPLDKSDLIRYITVLHTFIKNSEDCDTI